MIWGTGGRGGEKREGGKGGGGKGVGGGGHYYLKGVLIEARTMALCQQKEGKREGNEEETIGMVAIRREKGENKWSPLRLHLGMQRQGEGRKTQIANLELVH